MDGSMGRKKHQNQFTKATATGGSASTPQTRLNHVTHPLPPKPVQPGRSGSIQSSQTQQLKSRQVVSAQQTPSNPPPRAQPKPTGPSRPQAPPKPTQIVRRQGTACSTFLKLPADILAQASRIVPHLDPLDVIHLARVNISVRKVLMHWSASPMWRACIRNIGLPACPPELSEPRYVSVLYLPLCSSCGKGEGRKPDTYLFVRLCMPCRKQLLVDWSTIEPVEVRDLVLASDKSRTNKERHTGLKHSLKLEVEIVNARLHELQSSSDENALQKWTQTRKEELERRNAHARLVTGFMDTAQQRKTDELKRSWRELAERKLLKLGCTLKEEDLPYEKQTRWRSFFNRTEVITDSKWASVEKQILSFIETEAKDRPERERKQRHASRASALRMLFNSVRYAANTLPEDLSGVTAAETVPMLAKWLPPPGYDDIRESPIIQDLLGTDVPVEEMTIQFEERRGEITQLVIDWGTQVKQEWANILREGRKKDGLVPDPPRPRLPTSGADTDPFKDVDPDTSLLLRADNMLNFAGGSYSGMCSYDTLVMALRQGGSRYEVLGYGEFDLTKYTWDSEASAIARKLLLVVGHPDASTVEFNADPAQPFACGRCNASGRSWIALVVHYVEEVRKWKTVQTRLPDLAKLGIVYNYIHDLDSNSPRPLAKRVPAEEEEVAAAKPPQATQTSDANNVDNSENPSAPNLEGGGTGLTASTNAESENNEQAEQEGESEMEEDEPFPDRFACKICERGQIKTSFFFELSDIFPHLVDVHEISDPQAGINGEGSRSVKDSLHIRLTPPSLWRLGN